MAKVILKCRYLRAGHSAHSENVVKYIATRDGVEKLDDAWKAKPVSVGQQQLIDELLHDFPDSKRTYEYQDFLQSPTQGNASEFISRAIEENADLIGKKDNYVHYIAMRPHVEKMGAHGLFSSTDAPINLDQVAAEVAQHPGIVWTNVLSLQREDAARLGYEKVDAWRNLLRKKAPAMATAMKIPLKDLRWYASFHNEGHHPHCHIVAYSVGKEPYMSAEAILKLKAAFANEMFREDQVQIYEQQTKYRDSLTMEARDIIAEMVAQINDGSYQNPQMDTLMQELAKRLSHTTGKKVYGYLPQPTRNIVNAIVDELSKEPKIASLYNLWFEQRCQIVSFYQDTNPEKIPLSQNDVFKPVRNTVIKEALRILEHPAAVVLTEEPLADEPDEIIDEEAPTVIDTTPMELPISASTDEKQPPPNPKAQSDLWYQEAYRGFLAIEQQMADDILYYRLGSMNMHGVGTPKDLWRAKEYYEKAIALGNVDALYGLGKLYLDESFPEHDAARAVILLKKAAAQDHTYAQYTLGKLQFQGEVTEKNIYEAMRWLTKTAEVGNAYAQYFLGKALLYSEDIPHDAARGFQLLEKAAAQENIYAHYTLGKVFSDGEAAPQDIPKAIAHLEEAAKHGFSPAQYRLAKLYLAENHIEEAVKWLEQAVQGENQYAQYLLGKMLLFGQNIEKDVERGMALLNASAAQGNEYAQRIIHNYGRHPVGLIGARLFASLGRVIQNQIQEDNKQASIIDRKLRQKIEEKKQAHGLRMG